VRSPVVKRAVDLMGATVGLLVTAAPMALLALLVRRSVGSPVLFRQERAGRDGQPFTMLKFRTMRSGTAADGRVDLAGRGDGTDDGARLTPLGRWLRATSLDEVPQLWNVLLGHMSLVGPRPLLVDYLGRYTPEHGRRHEVRPGITGLAQVTGRNQLAWAERLDLDVRYVDSWTVAGDLAILARTVGAVARRRGVAGPEGPTMPWFAGLDP